MDMILLRAEIINSEKFNFHGQHERYIDYTKCNRLNFKLLNRYFKD